MSHQYFNKLSKLFHSYCAPLPVIIPITMFTAFSAYIEDSYTDKDALKSSTPTPSSLRPFERRLEYLSLGVMTGIAYPIVFPIYAIKFINNSAHRSAHS